MTRQWFARETIVETREAAQRWAKTWADAWPIKDVDAIVALQTEDGDHWGSMFRPFRGRAGLRSYVAESFAEAHRLGMFTVLWCYLRNNAFQKDGVN